MTQMDEKIKELSEALREKLILRRRDLHRHPEAGWTEFRTASIVVKELRALGYTVRFGADVMAESAMMGVPGPDELEKERERAVRQGADPELVRRMAGGKTGVVGTLRFQRPGPVVALRFDMDCNDIDEARDAGHRPFREGFASVNIGRMHACGHDGHTANGLAAAEILAALRDDLAGTIKLIFQPAEEGVRGARAMVEKGVADDVDYLIGSHMLNEKIGFIVHGMQGFLATRKFDAVFEGAPAHAGQNPHKGRNALAAAATAALQMLAIPRHGEGDSRINVGCMEAGTGRNVIPARAVLKVETRGETSEIDAYMYDRAETIIRGAAAMYDNAVEITQRGSAVSGKNSPALVRKIGDVARRSGMFSHHETCREAGGSEDCSYFMERVQSRGGQAAYLMVGASAADEAHTKRFDLDEEALVQTTRLLAMLAADLLTGK